MGLIYFVNMYVHLRTIQYINPPNGNIWSTIAYSTPSQRQLFQKTNRCVPSNILMNIWPNSTLSRLCQLFDINIQYVCLLMWSRPVHTSTDPLWTQSALLVKSPKNKFLLRKLKNICSWDNVSNPSSKTHKRTPATKALSTTTFGQLQQFPSH